MDDSIPAGGRQHQRTTNVVFQFPELKRLLVTLLEKLKTGDFMDSHLVDYKPTIAAFASIDEIIEAALGMVELEIFELEGQALSPEF